MNCGFSGNPIYTRHRIGCAVGSGFAKMTVSAVIERFGRCEPDVSIGKDGDKGGEEMDVVKGAG